jgi:ABC-2 type transport system ATP-binding protein
LNGGIDLSIISVKDLTKEFKRRKRKSGFGGSIRDLFSNEYENKIAVNDISFEIEKGEIIGYIGPNGAGKSTTIKMMVGILVPTKGEIHINGLEPYQNRIKLAQNMGVVFGQRTQLWWDIPVSESLKLSQYMYKIPQNTFDTNMELFKDILGIAEFIHIPVRQLSLGQRMRADLCMALLHNPEILYLDEPTIGLDVYVKEKIREFIREINKLRQTTVILTTHDMSDIERLCSRVMVIDSGFIQYDGSMQSLKDKYGNEEKITIELSEVDVDLKELISPGVSDVKNDKDKFVVKYDKSIINSTQVLKSIMEKYNIKDFKLEETSIEDIVKRMYSGDIIYENRNIER